ncbi:MAG TPA: DUF1974 domain-containing protein [Gammaproteobacteria bacterium]|jgi:hypothetical protein|nr:DUF1974 domain-containing protein [Gammaproteobacteria bacterium]HIL64455.1 DUF1974 domain-containing protein [Porticoccaceae bacterium]
MQRWRLRLSLSNGFSARRPVTSKSARYYQYLTRMSAALALVSDVTMRLLGGVLKPRRQDR